MQRELGFHYLLGVKRAVVQIAKQEGKFGLIERRGKEKCK